MSFYYEGKELLHNSLVKDLKANANFIAPLIQSSLGNHLESTKVIAMAPRVKSLLSVVYSAKQTEQYVQAKTDVQTIFNVVVNSKIEFSQLALFNADGELIVESQLLNGRSPIDLSINFQLPNQNNSFEHLSFYFVNNNESNLDKKGYFVIQLKLPTADESYVQLLAVINLTSFSSLLDKMQKPGKGFFITASQGQVLYGPPSASAHNDNSNNRLNQISTLALTSSNQEPKLLHSAQSDELSLDLMVYRQVLLHTADSALPVNLVMFNDAETLTPAFNHIRKRSIFVGGLLALVAYVFAFIVSRRLVGPLVTMTSNIKHYEATGEVLPLPTEENDETGKLATSFQRMMTNVEANNASMQQAIAQAQEFSQTLHLMLDAVTDAVLSFDARGNILAFNHAAELMFGYQAYDIIGQPFSVLLPDADTDFQQFAHQYVLKPEQKNNVAGIELIVKRRAGEKFTALANITEMAIGKDQIYTGVFRDHTNQQILEMDRNTALKNANELAWRLDFALSAPQIGVWEYNHQTHTMSWDKRMFRLYGYEKDDNLLPENLWWQAIHPDDLESVQQQINIALSDCSDLNIVFRVILPNKQVNYIETHAKAIFEHDGIAQRLVGTCRDITEQHKLQELKQQALEIAQESLKLKSDFLASMSHEIRTPMNGVLGMLNLLEQSELSKQQRHYLSLANASAISLLNLLNDILDFSKVEAGRLELEILDFDICALIGEVAESMALKAQEKGVELVLDACQISTPLVKGDPTRIRQILNNLVSNAVKFTDNGEVVIRAKLVKHEDELRFYCRIADTGIGIEKDKQQSLFKMFTQIDASTTRQYGGTGLGLAIVKRLCLLMNGQVGVKSEPGKGSEFYFDILLAESDIKQGALPRLELNDINILIVDDNQTNLAVLNELLSQWRANVTQASSAKQALNIIEQRADNYFAVAILDMQLPEMDGGQLAERLSKHSKTQQTKLIMMTSMNTIGDAEYFANVGISTYFPKPATARDLHDALAIVLDIGETLTRSESSLNRDIANAAQGKQMINSLAHLKILIVEDNHINQAVLEGVLSNYHGNACIAQNGKEALSILNDSLSNELFDVILMDCQMPVMDGYSATKAIRKGEAGSAYKNIPIIAMTANAMKGDKEKCLEVGMNDYLSKPVDGQHLYEKIALWCAVSKISQPLTDVSDSVPAGEHKLISQQAPTEPEENEQHFIVWDNIDLAKRVRGNEELVKRLVQLYVDEAPAIFEQLNLAISEGSYPDIVASAHKLKGSTTNLGGVKCARVAAEIEQAAKKQDGNQVELIQGELTASFEQLMTELNTYLSTAAEPDVR
ncbi:response regulator [Colwellia sp. MEBiC06753]